MNTSHPPFRRFQPAPPSLNETQRLRALEQYEVLDTPPEPAFDDIVHLAAQICHVPIALVSLIDGARQWFKARQGLSVEETPRDFAFCAHAILTPDQVMEVPNALDDDRFADNPLVTGEPDIRFYAGAPLVSPSGHALGTLCVIDQQERHLTPEQLQSLAALARLVVNQLELRQRVMALKRESLTDELTGVGNGKALDLALADQWARLANVQQPLGLAALNIDGFRRINDEQGRWAGDEALRTVVNTLALQLQAAVSDGLCPELGEVFRVDGSNLVLVLPRADAARTFERARAAQQAVQLAFAGAGVSLCAGVAVAVPVLQQPPQILLAKAEQALLQAKRQGPGAVELFAHW
jgi:diguanylate cyclase (GGDEF)-like protein